MAVVVLSADTHPGIGPSGPINKWWLTTGLSEWATSPTPYRTLRMKLLRYMSLAKASGYAAELYHLHYGEWPGKHSHDHQGRIVKK
jgi:hypothetical protein